MTDNIVTLVQKNKGEEPVGYVKITYTSGVSEVLQIDSFGPYDELPGYIICFREPEEVVGLFNSESIRSLEVLKDYNIDKEIYDYIS
jgi:hypothetical protein